ncbi:hypothetical protein Ciccas_012138 [Cichlidogyrus casuarinus]|uniref:G-protein coupled receptors family 1 profile domain-containing protein n=1 Tax=Cichlidogyrus casuarinus TaxID=1844966 RepID=A0ABD2PP95_9PLAT
MHEFCGSNSSDPYAKRLGFLCDYFWIWYMPLIISIGLVGNLLCVVFLFKSRLFAPNMLLWLVSICFGDIMTVAMEGVWISYKFHHLVDFRDYNIYVCKIHTAFSHYFFYFSAYMQCFLSIERAYIVLRPLRARRNSSSLKKNICLHICTSLLLLLPVSIYLVYWTVEDSNCSPPRGEKDKYHNTSTIIQSTVWGLIPLSIMITATVIICCSICNINNTFTKSSSSGSSNKSRFFNTNKRHFSEVNTPSLTNERSSKKRFRAHSVSTVPSGFQRHGGSDNSAHLTTLLVCMNIWYLITNFPFLSYLLYTNFVARNNLSKDKHRFFFYLTRSLCFLNYSFDWFFYCVAGRIFRRRVIQLMHRYFHMCFSGRRSRTEHTLFYDSRRTTDLRKISSVQKTTFLHPSYDGTNTRLNSTSRSASNMSLQSFIDDTPKPPVKITSRTCFKWKFSISFAPKNLVPKRKSKKKETSTSSTAAQEPTSQCPVHQPQETFTRLYHCPVHCNCKHVYYIINHHHPSSNCLQE